MSVDLNKPLVVTDANNTATLLSVETDGTANVTHLKVNGSVYANGGIGTFGQALLSDGNTVFWGAGAGGPTGQKGEKGDKGEVGPTGSIGPSGPTGGKGQKGEAGPTGPTGVKGQKGELGITGPTGSKGDIGPTGAKGEVGPAGSTGPSGQKGQKGDDGNVIPTQNTAPVSPTDGDLWWDTDVASLFIYYDDGTSAQWVEASPEGGDVYKVGTPLDNQVGVWTGDGTIEGDSDLTWNGATLTVNGDLTVTGNLSSTGFSSQVTANTTSNTQTAIYTFAAATYGAAELFILAKDTITGDRHSTKLVITHDGSTAYGSEYGTVISNASLTDLTVDVSGGNVRLLAVSASNNATNYVIRPVLLEE